MELKSQAMKILNVMAKALRMKPEEIFNEGMQSMRMNCYLHALNQIRLLDSRLIVMLLASPFFFN